MAKGETGLQMVEHHVLGSAYPPVFITGLTLARARLRPRQTLEMSRRYCGVLIRDA